VDGGGDQKLLPLGGAAGCAAGPAAQNVVPVAVTAAESVERLRTWASGRCLDAGRGGIYTGGGAKSTARRKVSRNPLSN